MTEKTSEEIDFQDFQKLDLRVAEILNVEEIKGADKLYKLEIDLGSGDSEGLGKRTLVAGIKQYYSPEELVGKKIVVIANLKPRTMKGVESQGMLLAAVSKKGNQEKVVLLSPEKDIESGVRVS